MKTESKSQTRAVSVGRVTEGENETVGTNF